MGKRLLLLVTDLLIGGTPTVVRELALRMHGQGVDVQVACLGKWGPVAEQITAGGVQVTALDAKGAGDLGVIWRLGKLITSAKIDVVYSSLVHANVAAAMVKAMGGRFELYQSIQTTQRHPRWHWWAQAVAGRLARQIVVPSKSVADALVSRSRIPSKRIVVIPNGVDLKDFASVVHKPGEAGQFRIGFIGRLDPVKRVPDLLEAMTHLPDGYVLDIYGQGSDDGRIRTCAQRLKLESRVRLRGAIPDPRPALEHMDVLVLPSEAEGFGLVLIEAMAARVPVVATDAPGICDVISHGGDGLLTPVGDVTRLAAAIRQVAEDANLREQLIAQGNHTVRERFTWEIAVPAYRALLGV